MPPVLLGAGAARETGYHLTRLGVRRALVVTDEVLARLGVPDPVVAAIRDAGVEVEVYAAPAGEPSVASMQAAAEHARGGDFDGFVGLGGGSALDTVKAAALLATHGGEILDWVNPPIGGGRAVPGPLRPVVALPTTAGTGSEVTAVAVLDVPEHRVKTGISHQHLRPRLAICDPELTIGCPPAVTAAVGLDALMHAIEAYVSLPLDARPRPDDPGARPPYQGANPLADVWVERAIELGGRYLRRAVADGSDLEARHGMLQCADLRRDRLRQRGRARSARVLLSHRGPAPRLGAAGLPGPGPRRAARHRGHRHGGGRAAADRAGAARAPRPRRRAADRRAGRRRRPGRAAAGHRASSSPTSAHRRASRRLGFAEADVPDLVAGALKQERLLKIAPLPVGAAELETVFRASL